ncbi:hypothetical protein DL93DRAFT_2164416 [Clavulina sp. PMI_390]|nr:hypothetical protein DL93DRAFT_2164416 [Clavulina sp. PMI_390]
MRTQQRFTGLLALVFSILPNAWSLADLQVPFSSDVETQPLRIAIIGARAGGSSAAFWVSKAAERHERTIHVDVYEQSNYIGGRSAVVYPQNNESLQAIELGAPTFAGFNKNMMRAVKEFNLTLSRPYGVKDTSGLWNGEKITVQARGSGWRCYDQVKTLWRYGVSSLDWTPPCDRELSMWRLFETVYSPFGEPWTQIEHFGSGMSSSTLTSKTFANCMRSEGVSERFIQEFVEPLIRSSYGQDTDKINAMMGEVSMRMATENPVTVEGGIFQVFEQFLNRSSANVHLNHKVTGVRLLSADGKAKWALSVDHSPPTTPAYDHVIIAAPFASSGIAIIDSPNTEAALRTPPVDYIRRHITLLTTVAAQPDPAYFNLPARARVPTFIATTRDSMGHGGKDSCVVGMQEPEFDSLQYLYQTKTANEHGIDEWAVKITSKGRISDMRLVRMFGEEMITWVERKEWDAYPKAEALETNNYPLISPANGLWYVNAFEPFISTMETETVASRNIIEMIFRMEFATGMCARDMELEYAQLSSTCAESSARSKCKGLPMMEDVCFYMYLDLFHHDLVSSLMSAMLYD